MLNKVAVLTTVFPMKEEYLCSFFESLEKQTCKKFDVIVVNDGYAAFEELSYRYSSLEIVELVSSGTPSKNRERGINYVKQNAYDVVVLADSDDYFEINRIEVSLKCLSDADVVVNDLSLFSHDKVYNESYLSNRLVNNQSLTINDIREKNFFGFSNTAFKLCAINSVAFDPELIAVDWYFFSCLLLEGNEAVFTNETRTYYRQYQGNTIGLGELTKKMLLRGLQVKRKQYELMISKDNSYSALLEDVTRLEKLIQTDADVEGYIAGASELQPKYPLWWENIKLPRN